MSGMNEANALAMLVRELQVSERLPEQEMQARQSRQIAALVAHHARHTPAFGARLARARLRADRIDSVGALSALPPLTRREIQDLGPNLFSRRTPPQHGATGKTSTSGSTGEPVTVMKTQYTALCWAAFTARDHRWHGRDVTARMVSIRPTITQPMSLPDWGYPMALLGRTGPALGLPALMDVSEHVRHIDAFAPDTLLVFPSLLAALVAEWDRRGAAPRGLAHLKTIGETVGDSLRAEARRVCNLGIEDSYTSQECGTMAVQCQEGGQYHVMAEATIIEVLDADGQPCRPGQMGRIVVTDLANYASPIIRYDIGDFAVSGEPCACGRTLPTLARIAGRARNLVVKPDGGRHWPMAGFHDFPRVAPVLQYQLIQHTVEEVELRVFTRAALDVAQEEALAGIVRRALGFDVRVRVTRLDAPLPRGQGGKFEDFISHVRTASAIA